MWIIILATIESKRLNQKDSNTLLWALRSRMQNGLNQNVHLSIKLDKISPDRCYICDFKQRQGGFEETSWSDGSSRTPKSVPSEFHVFAPAAAAWSRAQKSWGKKESVAVARWRGRHGIKGSNLSCLLQFHRSLVQPLVQWPEVQAWYKGILRSCVQ